MRQPTSETRKILFDAFRFISKSYDIIQRSALHLYYSALPFMPTKILLSNVYKKEDNLWQLGGGPEQWDALVAVPTHDNIYRIAFSLDNAYLASWAEHGIKLWHATSGAPAKTFNGDKIALAGDFSKVAICEDDTLALYNVTSYASVTKYDTPSVNIVELALSVDGSRLAAGLLDGTVT